MPWPEFRAHMRRAWRPGQHMALIGKTGLGKSTFATGIMEHRRYVLALDPKGGDDVLRTLGYPRLPSWPPPDRIWDEIAEGKPARFIVGPVVDTAEDWRRSVHVLRAALEDAFRIGGFTVYIDEFQILADRKMMGLAKEVETLLVGARSKGISVVTSYQAPAWVPKAASRQATWVALWPTRDQQVAKALADIVGRPWRMLWEAMEHLPRWHTLVIGPDPRDPMIITSAPKRG